MQPNQLSKSNPSEGFTIIKDGAYNRYPTSQRYPTSPRCRISIGIIAFLLILLSGNVFGQNILVFDVDTLSSPKIKAKFLAFDKY